MQKNNFQTLSEDRIEMINRFSKDEDLAKCLLCNLPNFKDYVLEDDYPYLLNYKNIFPYQKIINTQTEQKSYITMKFRYKRVKNTDVWKVGQVIFWFFCHDDLIQTNYGILRYDYMLQCVDRLLSDTRNQTWIGKMQFEDMEDVNINDNYLGIMVRYSNTELL